MDISQSVLAAFFARVAAGQFVLDTPQQLLTLLLTMARNLVRSHARKERARRWQPRPVPENLANRREPVDFGPSPSQVVALKDLEERWQNIHQRLSPEDRQLVDLRAAGRSWAEIAAAVGKSADGLRMRYTRVQARIVGKLGLQP
jgi:DNA-directed RNA polymerase specialized sigma24 family protein